MTTVDQATTPRWWSLRSESDRDGRFGALGANLGTLVVLALAVLVLACALALWRQNDSLTAARDERRDVARVAGEFATAVLSYDHRDLQGSVERVLSLSTRDWGRAYEDAWFQDQQPVVEELRAVAEVEVRDVLVGDAVDGVVPAVVVFDARIRSAIGTRRLGGSYLRLDVVDQGGSWRVDDMTYLASTEQSLDPAGPGGAGDGGGQGGGDGPP